MTSEGHSLVYRSNLGQASEKVLWRKFSTALDPVTLAVQKVLHTDLCKRFDIKHWGNEEQELMICAILFDPRYKDGQLLPL